MNHYIDGFLLPIKPTKLNDYTNIAQAASDIWREHGALAYCEAVADDIEKSQVSFKEIIGATEQETVIFAWIVYESKAERDRINAAVLADPRLKALCSEDNMPFEFKRMAFGGFRSIVRY